MHFKHPLVLVALLLIILPIIVHFFQLQKYTKTRFTNVKFLKNIILKNRKSSQLKKLLVLFSRILLFTFLVLAFAEPYISKNDVTKKTDIIIFLDNSFSMQAKDKNLNLFSAAIQDLIKFPNTQSKISLLSNDQQFKNLTLEQFKSQISKLKLSAVPFNLENTLFKITNLVRNSKNRTKTFIISDFQIDEKVSLDLKINPKTALTLVKLHHKNTVNVSIDSVFITTKSATKLILTVLVSNTNYNARSISLSLFNNNLLIAKSTLKTSKNKSSKTDFTIDNNTNFKGKITLEDQSLKFDNTLYFTTNKPKIIKVLSIGTPNKPLAKLYNSSDFAFKQSKIENLDFTQLDNQHLVILNAVEVIPQLLKSTLKRFVENGGTLIIIPHKNSDLNSYTGFFAAINTPVKINKVVQYHQITKINYAHPLLNNVFEKKVRNFDYPSVNSYYNIKAKNSSSILKLDNGADFISQIPNKNGAIYFVASPLEAVTNTFVNSPLIVPIFYNMALQGTVTNPLYYSLHSTNKIGINTHLKNDEVLRLNDGASSFIPQQQIKQNRVILETNDLPTKSGFYTVTNGHLKIQNLAFNTSRTESKLNFYSEKDLNFSENSRLFNDLPSAIMSFKNNTSIFELWKISIALALLFLIVELLLLKHLT